MKSFKETKEYIKTLSKEERKGIWKTWFKMKLKDVWWKFKNSSFVNHLSFLWHWKNFLFCLKYPFWKARNVWTGKQCGYFHTWYDDIPIDWQIAFGKQLSKDIKEAGKETRKKLGKHTKWKDMLEWEQIKEKWGELCLYASASDEIRSVLDKYELMSSGYCIRCGKPARYVTHGWIEYYCEKCFEESQTHYEQVGNHYVQVKDDLDKIEQAKKDCRITKEDIPHLSRFEYKNLKYEYIIGEKQADDRFDELYDDPNRPKDIHYSKDYDEEKGCWVIITIQTIEHEVDIKKEYDIDFKELWGL